MFCAIPSGECLASESPTAADISAYIDNLSQKYKVPAVLLKALVQQESRWNISASHTEPNGKIGMGLTQVTLFPTPQYQQVSLGVINPGNQGSNPFVTTTENVIVDVNRLQSDWQYNLEIGVRVLIEKKVKESGAGDDATILENWYYPLAAYNGLGDTNGDGYADNDPAAPHPRSVSSANDWMSTSKFPYQECVYNILAQMSPNPTTTSALGDLHSYFGLPVKVTLPGSSAVQTGAGNYICVKSNFYFFDSITFFSDGLVKVNGQNAGYFPVHIITFSGDTTPPTVSAFAVTPTSVTVGSPVTISYAVVDTGGSHLNHLEVWHYFGAQPPATWNSDCHITPDISLSGDTATGSFSNFVYAPTCVGTHWYGIHVVDGASPSNWNDEQNSRTGGTPGVFGPIQVTVTAALVAPITNALASGDASSPGPVLADTQPTYTWNAVSGATGGYALIITDLTSIPNQTYGFNLAAGTTSFAMPANTLPNSHAFEWSMESVAGGAYSSPSPARYFQTPAPMGTPAIAVKGWYGGTAGYIFNRQGSNGWGTYFGTVAQNSTPPTCTFTVQNTGTAPLTVGTPSVPSGFTIVEPLNSTIPVGGSDDFTVQMSTANGGTLSGNISIINDDAANNPFSFAISGTASFARSATTTTAFIASPSAVAYGQPVTFTATVALLPEGSATPNGGTVTFLNGGTALGSVTVNGGTASISTTVLASSLQSVTATYSGYSSQFPGSSSSMINTIAPYSQVGEASAVAIDASGNMFIAGTGNNCIYELNASSGTIITIAGNGTAGYNGDNIQATAASLNGPRGVALDGSGHLLITDTGNCRIRAVDLSTQVITTVVGDGTAGFGGDGGQAVEAQLKYPVRTTLDGTGNMFIADTQNNRIRKVVASTKVITTVAGSATGGFGGDNGSPTAAKLNWPMGIAVDANGNFFIADWGNNRIREVNVSTNKITTVAGNGNGVWIGDNIQATVASFDSPTDVALDNKGALFFASSLLVCKVDLSSGIITTAIGNTHCGYSDGGSPLGAQIWSVDGIAVASNGDVVIADKNPGIRRVSASVSVNVTPATLTVSADPKTRIYGNANPSFTATISGFQNGETLATSDVSGSPSFTCSATTTSPARDYTIVVEPGTLAAHNYNFNLFNGTLIVNPATLLVMADNKSRIYGDPNPTFTASYTGFKNGETLATSDVSGSPSFTCSATTTSPARDYTIVVEPGTLAAHNYNFNLFNGALTVNLSNDQKPAFSPVAGTYTSIQSITITCATTGATIYYTTDGSAPTVASPQYTSAITVSMTTTINAFAVKTGMTNSAVATAIYTINIPPPPIAPPIAPTITSALTSTATKGTAFNYLITATGTAPITFEATNLPSGLELVGATISGAPTVSGVALVTLKANNTAGSDTKTLRLIIAGSDGATNHAPIITSAPTANPNPVLAGQPVMFTVAASDEDGDLLLYSWSFGDGSFGIGNTTSHIYSVAGLYTAKVMISDGAVSVSQNIIVAVNNAEGTGTDSNAFAVLKAAITFNFIKENADSLTLSGTIPVETGFKPDGKLFTLSIADLESTLTLNAKGAGASIDGKERIKLSGKMSQGIFVSSLAKFVYSIKKTALFDQLKDLGFTNSDISKPGEAIAIPVIVTLNDNSYLSAFSVMYTANKNKRGSGKGKK